MKTNQKPTSRLTVITPKLAAKLLRKNDVNRKIRQRRVDRLVETIKTGQWAVNGETICVAKDGTLLNGQHRLTAVVTCGKSITTFVARGIDKSVMPTIDIGSSRGCCDHLRMAGYRGNHGACAAAIGICLHFKNGVYGDKKIAMSPTEMFAYLKGNKGFMHSFELLETNLDLLKLLPPSAAVATHWLFSQIDKEAADVFFHQLEKGENLGKMSPILKLRTELIAIRANSKRGQATRRYFLHLLCTAFDAYLHDRRVDRLPEYASDVKVVLPKKGK